ASSATSPDTCTDSSKTHPNPPLDDIGGSSRSVEASGRRPFLFGEPVGASGLVVSLAGLRLAVRWRSLPLAQPSAGGWRPTPLTHRPVRLGDRAKRVIAERAERVEASKRRG